VGLYWGKISWLQDCNELRTLAWNKEIGECWENDGVFALDLGVFDDVCRLGSVWYSILAVVFFSRADSAAKIVALESQLDASLRRSHFKRRLRFSNSFRLLWMLFVSRWGGWERFCHVMEPKTVIGWWRRGFWYYWRCVSRGSAGRRKIPVELRKLIRQMSSENPLWGAQKISDCLVDLGFEELDVKTIRKYMKRRPKDPSGNWLTFIRNHMDVSWAMDFCVVRTVGFKAFYVFVIIEHGSRRIRHWNITGSPSLEWIIQQLREATPFGDGPRFLHRDNDGLYGKGVKMFLKASGVEEVRSAFRSPWQNPYVERLFGSMRREILNHVIILNEKHLRRLISEYVEWYENHRLHQGLDGRRPRAKQGGLANSGDGKIISIPVLGGLHHRYERRAA
jgi:transposase InsO family protein